MTAWIAFIGGGAYFGMGWALMRAIRRYRYPIRWYGLILAVVLWWAIAWIIAVVEMAYRYAEEA